MAMAESLSKWKGVLPLAYFNTLNPDGTNQFSKEWHASYNGKVCYLEAPYGVLKFKLHTLINSPTCYVFFAFDNVFADRASEHPVKPNSINMGQMFNFHVLPVALPSLNKIKCFHGGLLWKNSKPVNVLNVTFDYERAVSILKKYLTSSNVINNAPIPAKMPSPVVAPPMPKSPVKEALSGQTAMVWKAINNDEGLMFLRKTKGGHIVWFNRSNLEKVETKFNHLNELVGVQLHFDAELLHAPANPSEFVWYQGTAFWDSGRLRPSMPNGVVGLKILHYEPKSDFSLRLKRGVEFKLKNPLSYDKIDNVFRDLANARLFKDVSSPPKKEVADGKEAPALQKKEVNHLLDTIKKLSEDVKSLKIVNQDRRTSFSGFSEDWKAKSCVSLPNEVKNETHVPKTGMTNYLNYWTGNDIFYFNFPKPENAPAGQRELFRNEHFLNLKKTVSVPDYFSSSLNVKTVFKRLLCRKCESGETKVSDFPEEIKEEDFVDKSEAEKYKKVDYLKTVAEVFFFSVVPENVVDRPKYLLKESGSINHLSENFKAGLIRCQYGCVYFKWEDFLDGNEKLKTGKQILLNSVFFDGYYDPYLSCPYVATCVWTEKRPDIQGLIESVADVPKKLKPGKYEGRVVKLDLPSNAIVKLKDENVGVVVTRGIFDPTRTENIADFLSLRENLEVEIEGHTVNNYYAEKASRRIRLPPNLSKTIQGYGVYTNCSNRFGIFEYRLKDSLLTGIFSKDLVKYLPLGSYIRISGYVTNVSGPIRIIATEVKNVKILKENPTEDFLDSEDELEFVPKKAYVGVVKEVRKPYACVLEAVNEQKEEVNVFVQSRKLALGASRPNLGYKDQIQYCVKVGDKIKFTAEVCSDTLGLHPFKWHAERAWKMDKTPSRLIDSSEGAVKKDLNSFPTAWSGIQAGYKYVQPYQPIKKEESRSNFMFPAPVNNVKEESLIDDMIKNTLRNSLRDEAVMPESLMTKIVDNFCKRLNKEMLVGVNNNKTGKTKPMKDKSTQTVSTGKVIYLKIHPA